VRRPRGYREHGRVFAAGRAITRPAAHRCGPDATLCGHEHGRLLISGLTCDLARLLGRDDLRATRTSELLGDLERLVADQGTLTRRIGEEGREVSDEGLECLRLLAKFGHIECGETRQPQVQDLSRLKLTQLELLHQGVTGGLARLRPLDDRDHTVDRVDRDEKSRHDVLTALGNTQVVLSTPHDDPEAMVDENLESLPDAQDDRAAIDQGEKLPPEGLLEHGALIQLVEDLLRIRIALERNDNPDPVAVRLVAQVSDPFDPLLAHLISDLL